MGWGGRLFEAGRLLTFSAFSMGAYSRWALIRINTVHLRYICQVFFLLYSSIGYPQCPPRTTIPTERQRKGPIICSKQS